MYGGLIAWPFARADEVLRAYRELTPRRPRELTVVPDHAARAAGAVRARRDGTGERDLRDGGLLQRRPRRSRRRARADPRARRRRSFDLLHEQPYTELQSYLDATEPKRRHYYWRTEYVAELQRRSCSTTLARPVGDVPDPRRPGRACCTSAARSTSTPATTAPSATATPAIAVGVNGCWEPGDPDVERTAVGARRAASASGRSAPARPTSTSRPPTRATERRAASYGANLERLRALKRRVRPGRDVPSARLSVHPACPLPGAAGSLRPWDSWTRPRRWPSRRRPSSTRHSSSSTRASRRGRPAAAPSSSTTSTAARSPSRPRRAARRRRAIRSPRAPRRLRRRPPRPRRPGSRRRRRSPRSRPRRPRRRSPGRGRDARSAGRRGAGRPPEADGPDEDRNHPSYAPPKLSSGDPLAG